MAASSSDIPQEVCCPPPAGLLKINAIPFSARGHQQYRILSNLATVPNGLEVGGVRYRSLEAAYVSRFKFGGRYTQLFAAGGILGSMERFKFWYRQSGIERQFQFKPASWPGMDGIVAKIIGGKGDWARVVRRQLEMENPQTDDDFSWDAHEPMWRDLLDAKWRACERFRACLRSTDKRFLYEFDRSAAKVTGRRPVQSLWGGCFSRETGKWNGRNVMGKLVMECRDRNVEEEWRNRIQDTESDDDTESDEEDEAQDCELGGV